MEINPAAAATSQLTVILTTVILTVLGGGTVAALIAWLRHRPQDKAETRKVQKEGQKLEFQLKADDIDAYSKLGQHIRTLVDEKLAKELELAAARKQLEIKDGFVAESSEMIKTILVDHGRMLERERNCEKRLNALEEWKTEQEPLLGKMTALNDRVLEQAAELKQARDKGTWDGKPELLEPIK
jgi:hypothetical protein